MGDLSDEDVECFVDLHINTHEPASMRTVIPLAREVMRHRAAQTASAERVREVVREAVLRFAPATIDGGLADAIASRVAAQLAPAPPPADRVHAAVSAACDSVLPQHVLRTSVATYRHCIVKEIADRAVAQLGAPAPSAIETRILDLKAAVGYEIANRDAALARLDDLEAAVLRMTETARAAAENWMSACQQRDEARVEATAAEEQRDVYRDRAQRMSPVVAAADAWLDDPCKGSGSHREHDLDAAVRTYRGAAPNADPADTDHFIA